MKNNYTEKENRKPFIDGPGVFRNLNGESSIHGQTILRNWGNILSALPLLMVGIFILAIGMLIAYAHLNTQTIILNGVPYTSVVDLIEENPVLLALFLLEPLVGLYLLYKALTTAFNKTIYEVSSSELEISSGPLPTLRRNRKYRKNDIAQFYVKRKLVKEERDYYQVIVQLKNGPEEIIDGPFFNYSDARILEQWLESKLKLQDVNTVGEE